MPVLTELPIPPKLKLEFTETYNFNGVEVTINVTWTQIFQTVMRQGDDKLSNLSDSKFKQELNWEKFNVTVADTDTRFFKYPKYVVDTETISFHGLFGTKKFLIPYKRSVAEQYRECKRFVSNRMQVLFHEHLHSLDLHNFKRQPGDDEYTLIKKGSPYNKPDYELDIIVRTDTFTETSDTFREENTLELKFLWGGSNKFKESTTVQANFQNPVEYTYGDKILFVKTVKGRGNVVSLRKNNPILFASLTKPDLGDTTTPPPLYPDNTTFNFKVLKDDGISNSLVDAVINKCNGKPLTLDYFQENETELFDQILQDEKNEYQNARA